MQQLLIQIIKIFALPNKKFKQGTSKMQLNN